MASKNQRPIALIILDGWGISDDPHGNAVLAADTPFLDHLLEEWPSARIKTSGSDVGLPDGQMGNSEVGHMNIGAGRIVYQDLLRISNAIEDGTFFENEAIRSAMSHAASNNKTLHLAGLLSDGGVHSHLEHLFALIDMAKREGVKDVAIHAFFDGRDTPPQSGIRYMEALLDRIDKVGLGRVASLSGRYYAMDRDNRWERLEKAYRCLTAVDFDGARASDPIEAIRASYEKGVTDEFIVPVLMVDQDGAPIAPVREGDSFIFINFRPDRARELTRAFCQPEFDKFPVVATPLAFTTLEWRNTAPTSTRFPISQQPILPRIWREHSVRSFPKPVSDSCASPKRKSMHTSPFSSMAEEKNRMQEKNEYSYRLRKLKRTTFSPR